MMDEVARLIQAGDEETLLSWLLSGKLSAVPEREKAEWPFFAARLGRAGMLRLLCERCHGMPLDPDAQGRSLWTAMRLPAQIPCNSPIGHADLSSQIPNIEVEMQIVVLPGDLLLKIPNNEVRVQVAAPGAGACSVGCAKGTVTLAHPRGVVDFARNILESLCDFAKR